MDSVVSVESEHFSSRAFCLRAKLNTDFSILHSSMDWVFFLGFSGSPVCVLRLKFNTKSLLA